MQIDNSFVLENLIKIKEELGKLLDEADELQREFELQNMMRAVDILIKRQNATIPSLDL